MVRALNELFVQIPAEEPISALHRRFVVLAHRNHEGADIKSQATKIPPVLGNTFQQQMLHPDNLKYYYF